LTGRRVDETQDRATEGCLSTPRLADQAERFTGQNIKRHAIDSFNGLPFPE
jgi:peptide deformylase